MLGRVVSGRPPLGRMLLSATALVVARTPVRGDVCSLQNMPVCTWAGNDNGFYVASLPGESATIINFETLPDGSPSHGGVYITPGFNYVLQGATFVTPISNPYIAGNAQLGYALDADSGSPIIHDWITAELTHTEEGVGVYSAGNTTLYVYDAQGALITSTSYVGFPNVPFFLGVKSNTPIASARIDRGAEFEVIDNFTIVHFPAPEPMTAALLMLGMAALGRRPITHTAAPRSDRAAKPSTPGNSRR